MVCRILCETEIQFTILQVLFPIDPVKRAVKVLFVISNMFVAF
jgi:hypothetical protein